MRTIRPLVLDAVRRNDWSRPQAPRPLKRTARAGTPADDTRGPGPGNVGDDVRFGAEAQVATSPDNGSGSAHRIVVECARGQRPFRSIRCHHVAAHTETSTQVRWHRIERFAFVGEAWSGQGHFGGFPFASMAAVGNGSARNTTRDTAGLGSGGVYGSLTARCSPCFDAQFLMIAKSTTCAATPGA